MTLDFLALSGFLGAGKTTTLLALARELERRGRRVAVITNDQGTDLVDSALAAAEHRLAAEVTGGCFCCRFDDLLEVASAAIEKGADTVLAEAVGSCTDLQATVLRPLARLHGAAFRPLPLAVVVDPGRFTDLARTASADLAYLFDRQLAEADVIALNKADLGDSTPVREALAALHPGRLVVPYSARTGEGVEALLAALARAPAPASDVAVDYDRYAAAEAELAWLNHTVRVSAAGEAFDPGRWADALLARLSAAGFFVGHAKVHLAGADGAVTKASLTAAGAGAVADAAGGPVGLAEARINVRMACAPAELDRLVAEAVAAADAATGGVTVADVPPGSFSPAYPRPVHRMAV